MRCQDAAQWIGAWQDGELDAWTSWRVGRHVRHCPACAAEAESLTDLTARLRRVAPLGAWDHTPQPRRATSVTPLALALAVTTVVTLVLLPRTPTVSPSQPDLVIVQQEARPHSGETRSVETRSVVVVPSKPARTLERLPEGQRITIRKRATFRSHAVRVERKPSLLPPLTHPVWEGSPIRYVAHLTPEERQVEIISVESELPPVPELKRLIEEKSEFIYVQASLPPALREGAQIPILVIP